MNERNIAEKAKVYVNKAGALRESTQFGGGIQPKREDRLELAVAPTATPEQNCPN
jgi:hypothetical protein